MIAKPLVRNEAILLRKQGYSYSEIAGRLLVSKSTLSLWLRDIKLTSKYKRILESKKRNGQVKGAFVRKEIRKNRQQNIIDAASKELERISKRELWLVGILAYWCEGSKQKEGNVSQGVVFANSDLFLLKLCVKWLKEICMVDDENISYTLYIHQNADASGSLLYWQKALGLTNRKLNKIVLKKHNILTNRKYINVNYNGLIRITVKKSTDLNRKIKGWVLGINNNL